MEALSVIEPPNIVPPSENAVGTAVILDFMSDFKIILEILGHSSLYLVTNFRIPLFFLQKFEQLYSKYNIEIDL